MGRATSEQVDRVASFLDTDNQRAANAIVGAHTAFTATQEQLQTAAPGIDPAFAGERPSNYSANDAGVSTVKYIILMTTYSKR